MSRHMPGRCTDAFHHVNRKGDSGRTQWEESGASRRVSMRASVEQLLTLKDHQKLERVQLFGPVLEREDSSSLARQVVEAHKQLSSAPTLKHNIVFYGQTVLNCALATPSAEDFIGSLSLTVPFGIEVVLASFGYHSGDVARSASVSSKLQILPPFGTGAPED
jgi:hypothetical protein